MRLRRWLGAAVLALATPGPRHNPGLRKPPTRQ